MKVLHEDRDYLIIDKPAGMHAQPSPTSGGNDVITQLAASYGTVYPIHRLDVGTSGLMAVGRTKKGASALCAQVASGEFEKEYLAICEGEMNERGEMEDLLLHRSASNKSFVVDRMRAGVREARLSYTRICFDGTYSRVRVKLQTGRTHQIRVQFAHRGHPLRGDGKYGARSKGEMGLACVMLAFRDPRTGKRVVFEREGMVGEA